MSEIVALAATVHAPYITGWPNRASTEHRQATFVGFKTLGDVFKRANVDTIVVFTSEHIVNLEPRMAPAFTIGVGNTHPVFPEPQFGLSTKSFTGDRTLALELVKSLYEAGFDPAHSVAMQLDHGTVLPLSLMGFDSSLAIVPILVNTLFHPLPTLSRCRALGIALAEIIERSSLPRRVGVVATGGISHTVGKPHPERNYPAFDRAFIEELAKGKTERCCALSDQEIENVGNGTQEIRNWIAVAAAARPVIPRVVTAIPFAPGWDTAVFQLLWEAA
jgi:aromatic ring-opening dioxygenase catalytic subunit (LigB family)